MSLRGTVEGQQMDLLASPFVQVTGERRIKHYSNTHKILLVGEGDFSFSVCLANAFGSALNMVATSLDSIEKLMSKYSRASENLKTLRDLGCTLIHEVNVNTMGQHPLLHHQLFDRIVFIFPHAGFMFREHDSSQIMLHQGVVRSFFSSARNMLKENGEVHVTHKTGHPFSKWEIEDLAKEAGLSLAEKFQFYLWEYPGYTNKYGEGYRCDDSFPVGQNHSLHDFKTSFEYYHCAALILVSLDVMNQVHRHNFTQPLIIF